MEQYIFPLNAGGGPAIPEPTVKVLGVENGAYSLLPHITYEEIIDVAKGDLITMNVDGTDRQFRVLKNVSGTVYEVLGLFNTTNSIKYNATSTTATFADGTEGQKYADSTLDTALNITWYGTLSANAKSAIVDKNIVQEMWYMSSAGNPDYVYRFSTSSNATISINEGATLSVGNRHIYALSLADVIEYLGVTPSMTSSDTTWTKESFLAMLFNASTHSETFGWFMDAVEDSSAVVEYRSSDGRLFATTATNSVSDCIPAFQIDLSKIPYTKV